MIFFRLCDEITHPRHKFNDGGAVYLLNDIIKE